MCFPREEVGFYSTKFVLRRILIPHVGWGTETSNGSTICMIDMVAKTCLSVWARISSLEALLGGTMIIVGGIIWVWCPHDENTLCSSSVGYDVVTMLMETISWEFS